MPTWLTIIFNILDKYSNLLLVFITALYAFLTYRMVSAMKYQFTSEIKLGNKKLGTSLEEDWFKERINDHSERIKNSLIEFKFCFDIFNKKPGAGSISKPIIIMKFPNNHEERIEPNTKEHNSKKIDDNTYEEWEDDLGNTIYLKGGDFLNIELKYDFVVKSDEIIKYLKQHENISYYVEYYDNSYKKYRLKITNVKKYEEVGRN